MDKIRMLPFVCLLIISCSKSNDNKQKANIVEEVQSFSLLANSSGGVRGLGAVWKDNSGNTKNVQVDIGPDATLKNGTATLSTSDIVADNSQIIPSGITNVAAITKPTNPNTITLILNNNSDVATITLNITPSTIAYLGDNGQFPNYTLSQLDSAFRALANQIPGLYSQITLH